MAGSAMVQKQGNSGSVLMNKPLISVVICTYNNADSLAVTLAELSSSLVEDTDLVEVVIVDNNSSDSTARVIEEFSVSSPYRVLHCFQPEQGLSAARNMALSTATGDYILFTDDDAEIQGDWLSEYISAISNDSPDALFSRIYVIWDKPKPWWYLERYGAFFVQLDYGDTAFWIDSRRYEFFGKNFCCKRSILTEYGGFSDQLGRKGESLLAGEETLIFYRLLEDRRKILYFPSAPVGHRLKDVEYTEEFFRRKYVEGAASALYLMNLTARRRLLGRGLYPLSVSIRLTVRGLLGLASNPWRGDPAVKFFNKLQVQRNLRMLKLWMAGWGRP